MSDLVRSETIAGLDLFRGAASATCAALAKTVRVDHHKAGAYIGEQGAKVERAYALSRGSARLIQTGADGGQALIRFLGPGDMFATAALFAQGRFPADIVALEAVVVLSWPREVLFRIMERDPVVAVNVIRILGTRLAQLQERIREKSFLRADQRIALALLRLLDPSGRPQDAAAITIPLRRQDVAEFAGTTLYTASRIIAGWEKSRWLKTTGRRLMVLDPAALRRLAEDGVNGSSAATHAAASR